MEKIIKFSVVGDEVFVDLFGGSGSALKAAKLNKRKAVAIELDGSTCDMMADHPDLKGTPVIGYQSGFDWQRDVLSQLK